ncbi:MAG TPA: MDR family MFS transporter [Candidatus Saccharimonadaceae bacterium]|nr:MDR family MFS transporter [Candidatus Saccharimonadaceae bacterium]
MLHQISMRQKALIMVAVMAALFLVALDQTIIATSLTKIVEQFNAYDSLGFIVTAYLLLSTVTVPLAGKMSDMFGRRPILLIGVIVFTVGSFLSGSSQNITQLIAYRALQGFGGGVIAANAFTIIGDLFTPRERGRWQGIFGAVFGLASVVGPLLGGWLTDAHQVFGLTTDWRWTFFINIPVGIFAAFVIARYCPTIKHENKPKVDWAGSSYLTIALAALVLAVDNTATIFKFLVSDGWNVDLIKLLLYIIAVLSGALFIWAETRAKEPVIPLSFFKNRTFTSVMIAALLFGAAFLGAILYLTQFNQQVFDADATTAGLMLLPMIGGMMVASTLIGQVVTKTGKYKRFIVVGFIVATLSVLSLVVLEPNTPYWHEAIIMAFAGVGLGTAMPILTLAVQNEFEQKDLGVATASSQLFRGLGSTIGTAMLSGILTAGITAQMGHITNTAYIQTLRKNPQSASVLKDGVSANTALELNQQGDSIRSEAHQAIDKSSAPAPIKQQLKKSFDSEQKDFNGKITQAFATALHKVFYVSGALMGLAFIAILFLKERELRNTHGTPGVE